MAPRPVAAPDETDPRIERPFGIETPDVRSARPAAAGETDLRMERLSEIMGSLYFLQPLCQQGGTDWRAQMEELITLDEPDDDRRQRLAGAFNGGYTAYARFHRSCTPAAREALTRLLGEAQRIARDIHTRFAE